MPFHIKMGLTVVVGLAAIAGWFYMGALGKTGPQMALMFLGPFTMGSLWVFPEVMRGKGDRKPLSSETSGRGR